MSSNSQIPQERISNIGKHVLESYYFLRLGAAIIGILLPLVLWFGGETIGIKLLDSMSAYYHTSFRNVFVGGLCAIGAILGLYKGFSPWEDLLLDLSGIFIVLVALLPMACPSDCDIFTAPFWHGFFAIAFFVLIAIVAIFFSDETLAEIKNPQTRAYYQWAYRLLGAGMIVLPAGSALILIVFQQFKSLVFFLELAGIFAFSAFWIVKSVEMYSSKFETKAFMTLMGKGD